ncbi:unnamed protein product, partial [Iphiclides podalirius]
MKTIAVALILMFAGVNAVPYEVQNVDLEDKTNSNDIIGIVDSITQLIKDNGLDPYVVEWAEGAYNLPVNGIFSAEAYIKNFVLSGLSNWNVNDIGFNKNILSVDIELPLLEASVGLRVAGQLNLGLSGQLTDRLVLQCSLGDIESELYFNLFGNDLSDSVNDFVGNRVPSALIEFEEQLNRLFVNIITSILNRLT